MRRVKLTHAMKMDTPYIVGDANEELLLRDFVAAFVVTHGNGIYIDEEPVPGPSRAVLEQQEAQIGTLKQVGEESPEPGELMKRPYGNAPKSSWVRYAVHGDHGQPPITQERAEMMTKADLMSRYGERL